MYGAGIAAQEGFIRGLEADDAKLLAATKTLTAKVTAEVKKQLGIKSPSRVFKSLGRFTVDGSTGGMEDRYATAQKSLSGFATNLTQAEFAAPAAPKVTPQSGANATASDNNERLVHMLIDALANMHFEVSNTVGTNKRTAAEIVLSGIQGAARTDRNVLQTALR
ncbi:hypothetical protein ACTVCO_10120 [Sanguibacter sp. A247]|uniref:hypothetical protein n=1 Tax=unclassified Sanguibacter TaxID=2645534 RepID=UPI003FD8E856